MTVALVYARASSDPTDQKISVDRQVKLCTERSRQLWPDAEVKVFRDDGITAADPTVHRPGFTAFLTAVRTARQGELAGVVVNEQSRLTRQGNGAWDELVVTLTRAGLAEVQTLRSGPVSVEPGNRLVGRILAVVDTEEVERTKARVQAAHRELFAEGRPSSRAPFGYRSTKDSAGRSALEPDPITAPIVQQVFAKALAGHAIAAIADWLNVQSVPPPSASWKITKRNGRPVVWQPTTVRTLLTTPSVAGLRAHTDPEGLVHTVPAKWEALVDPDQWRQVQRLLGQPTVVTGTDGQRYKVRTKPAPQPRRYLLSGGVLRCGKCGYRMEAQTQSRRDKSRIAAYQCDYTKDGPGCGGVSISPAEEVEAMVVEAIQRRLATSQILRQRLEATQNGEAAHWRAERDAARARMLEAAEMRGAGTIDLPTFTAMHNPARAALEHAEARLSALATDDLTLPSAEDVAQRWDQLTLRQQRAVIERLISRIVVAPGRGKLRGLDRVGAPEWLA